MPCLSDVSIVTAERMSRPLSYQQARKASIILPELPVFRIRITFSTDQFTGSKGNARKVGKMLGHRARKRGMHDRFRRLRDYLECGRVVVSLIR